MKYVRLYGLDHKRTEGQFVSTWKELQDGLPKGADGAFLLGVSENKLLLDGIPLETGQAERSFAQLLTTAGLASIHFSNQVTKDEFIQLVRAFAMGGSRAQDVVKEIKSTFGDSKTASIRINEVRLSLPIRRPARSALQPRLRPRRWARNSSSGLTIRRNFCN